MALLDWTDALALELPLMDDTHKEFVDLLAAVETASDPELPTRWQALVEHTEAHFGQEDRWMDSTRFAAGNCHATQHRVVLQVLREAGAAVQQDPAQLPILRRLTQELALWFPQHAQSMDAALALHLRRVGYDPVSGVVSAPEALPAEAITGCGSSSCSDIDLPQTADAIA